MPDRLPDYDYTLPPHLIAQTPLPRRDRSRLMLMRRGKAAGSHHLFADLPGLLPPDCVLVVNNTRVLPHRLAARLSTGARMEALLLEEEEGGTWRALVKKSRRLAPGMKIPFAGGRLMATALEPCGDGSWRLEFENPVGLPERLEREGLAPLPPYIRRDIHGPYDGREDRRAYQTCYASVEGAVAAPTAGLHFTRGVFAALRERGIEPVELTLHVGQGTFAPVKENDLARHVMHREWIRLPPESARVISDALAGRRPVIAVGTTTVRALESWAAQGAPAEFEGWSDLFIRPPYEFRVIAGLITNFHQPRSTLLMLVSAFHGRERLFEAYREAVEREYRFFSFGDCMAILP